MKLKFNFFQIEKETLYKELAPTITSGNKRKTRKIRIRNKIQNSRKRSFPISTKIPKDTRVEMKDA